jgi:hypothetical protein
MIDEYQKKSGKSEEEIDTLLKALDELNRSLNDGIITEAELDLADKILNTDKRINTAANAAAIAAKNENIEAKMKKDLKPKGDGLPKVGGAGNPVAEKAPQPNSLWNTQPRKSVWQQ